MSAEQLKVDSFQGDNGAILSIDMLNARLGYVHTAQGAPQQQQQNNNQGHNNNQQQNQGGFGGQQQPQFQAKPNQNGSFNQQQQPNQNGGFSNNNQQ